MNTPDNAPTFHPTQNPIMDDDLIIRGMSKRELAIRRRVHRLAEFYQHLSIYVLVIGALWALNLWQVWDGSLSKKWYAYWAVWPAFGWGIGVLCHGLAVLPVWRFFSEDWEDRKVQELLARDAAQADQLRHSNLTDQSAK